LLENNVTPLVYRIKSKDQKVYFSNRTKYISKKKDVTWKSTFLWTIYVSLTATLIIVKVKFDNQYTLVNFTCDNIFDQHVIWIMEHIYMRSKKSYPM